MQLGILDLVAIGALSGGHCTSHQDHCVLGVGVQCVLGGELCPLSSGIIVDATLYRVQGRVDGIAMDL